MRLNLLWACFKWFNPEIDWRTIYNSATTIPLVKMDILYLWYQAYTNNSKLETVSDTDFVKGSKQGEYTWCGYKESI